MIKDVFDEIAADHAEREETTRKSWISGDDEAEDLDAVDADEDAQHKAFPGELYSPSD